ncbi:oviduct-specific glycoprotein [Fusarium sporotrichioides]|uniref:Oviduct-specific glycoprotein n=1 Tax=Fusarium sporotrichioides TaxID=5514 RepID=A0A395RF50_FUSSP|nr:oviduct-specific glycoprotein [Fusarium sporotrichioides]
MEEQLGVVFVAAGGNIAAEVNSMPAYAARHLKGMLAIGASTQDGVRASFSAWVKKDVDWFVYAPGDLLPSPPDGIATGDIEKGTSFASPLVAGLVAYLRASPYYQGGTSPADIRQAVSQTFSRKVTYTKNPGANRRRIIWNGQSGSKVCVNGKSGPVARQLNSCPYDGSSSGGSGGNNGGSAPRGSPVTYIPGPNGPLCKENCGTLCSGFYCDPRPTGTVPDFTPPASIPSNGDPNEDPNHLPGLPDLPDPAVTNGIPVGKVCVKETTAIECNGGPRGGVCQTKTTCISTGVDPNFPVITPWQPPSSPAGATCASSTTWTLLGGPKGQATVTSSACASWKAKETPKPDPPKPKRRCITGHTYMRNCIGSPDTMYVQVWDNGILICDSGNGVWWASDKSVYRMDCAGGAKVEVTDNGSQITYTAADGFFISGKNYDKQFDTQVCGTRPGRGDMPDVDIEGWLFENTFKTSDCDGWCPIPRLCDFDHSSCPFDGRCSS